MLDVNPMAKVKKLPEKNNRTRCLEENEIAKLEEKKARRVIKELFYHYCGVLKPICPSDKIVRVVTDYISGMTDRYAVERFKENFMPTGLKTSAREDYLFRLAASAD